MTLCVPTAALWQHRAGEVVRVRNRKCPLTPNAVGVEVGDSVTAGWDAPTEVRLAIRDGSGLRVGLGVRSSGEGAEVGASS
jgi:hypothetical protein